MKLYTNKDQTAKLIELGFEKPRDVTTKSWQEHERDNPFIGADTIEYIWAYSIGELIEILEEVASVVISYSYQKRGYYVRVIIPKRIGGGMYRISQTELVDALYDMILRLKEEGEL